MWEAKGDLDNDLVDNTGNVTFTHGVTTGNIEIKIRGDTVPELDETYQIQLVSAARVIQLNML